MSNKNVTNCCGVREIKYALTLWAASHDPGVLSHPSCSPPLSSLDPIKPAVLRSHCALMLLSRCGLCSAL